MLAIPEVSDVDIAFAARALDWMPSWDEIPEEFKYGDTEWNKIVSRWFFRGLSEKVEFHPKKGVDAEKAFRVIQATMGSFAPKHEHKEAACAYMLSEWFTKIKNWKK
jgi:hypothetical protein